MPAKDPFRIGVPVRQSQGRDLGNAGEMVAGECRPLRGVPQGPYERRRQLQEAWVLGEHPQVIVQVAVVVGLCSSRLGVTSVWLCGEVVADM